MSISEHSKSSHDIQKTEKPTQKNIKNRNPAPVHQEQVGVGEQNGYGLLQWSGLMALYLMAVDCSILSIYMIKQTEIGNFVSLIKSLKKQLNNEKSKIKIKMKMKSLPHASSLPSCKSKSKKKNTIQQRMLTTKENVPDCRVKLNTLTEDNNCSSFRADYRKPQVLQRKKLWQMYNETKKNREDSSTRGRSDLSSEALERLHDLKFLHRRSSTNFGDLRNEKKSMGVFPDKLELGPKQQHWLHFTVFKNESGKSQKMGNLKKESTPLTNVSLRDKLDRNRLNYLLTRTKMNENAKAHWLVDKNANYHENWVLDAWEQPKQETRAEELCNNYYGSLQSVAFSNI